MHTLTTTQDLAAFCAHARNFPYVTIDTEFLREKTYWPKLCLVQLALPGDAETDAVLVDPLVDGLSLEPLYELLRDTSVIKVFHAARQDLEIFFVEGNVFPDPLFDTQVAGMVCGYGEQASYETLARSLAKVQVDKSSRFTDWTRRPLSEAQQIYALADVTHLRTIYEALKGQLEKSGRSEWIDDELATLTDPATYTTVPEDAWLKVRTRSHQPRFLAIVKELARFREEFAISQNIARSRLFKDDALLEIASAKPTNLEELQRCRLLFREGRKPDVVEGILAAVKRALALPNSALPKPQDEESAKPGSPALVDLLKVLLKARAESSRTAQRLIASSSDIDRLAAGDRDVPVLDGWRFDAFGRDALRLCEGQVALTWKGKGLKVIDVQT
ncbi:MAG: ribonuclease D [Deltaproteobacteria bacterium]